jgi:hypothetical protein
MSQDERTDSRVSSTITIGFDLVVHRIEYGATAVPNESGEATFH